MWADFSGKAYSREQFAQRVAQLQWTLWKPIGIVLHNTAAPTLAQWAESGPRHEARIRNLQNYYESMGWKGGPQWFISRNWFNEFSNPLRPGTHSPSFNRTHFGIEMVGNFETEEFDSGDGALVRDNSIFAMAVLCKKFGFDPDSDIVLHKEDPRTNHDCPGKNVDKDDVIERVKLAMAGLTQTQMPKPPVAPVGRHMKIHMTEFGDESELQEASYGGMVDPNSAGVALPFKFRGAKQRVLLYRDGLSVLADIVDVGPHNIHDDYWTRGARPLAEQQFRDGLKDFKGRLVTNSAGIDATPAVFDALKVSGARGTRSVVVDWEFSDELTVEKNWGAEAPVGPTPVPPVVVQTPPKIPEWTIPLSGVKDATVEMVQQRLMKLAYHEVGDVDGLWGGKTLGAISAFRNDRHIGGLATIDTMLIAELGKAEAEGWKRPIATTRSEATEAAVEKKAPEITPVRQSRVAALWAGIGSAFFAMVNWVGDSFKDVLTWLTYFKDQLNQVPGWIWLAGMAGGLAYFYWKSRKGAEGIVNSVKSGERN